MISSLSLQNFKGVSATHLFGACNLIQGPNFAGKSAIDQAIRLLVLGNIPGVSATQAGIKMFASDYPMEVSAAATAGDRNLLLRVAFDRVKSAIKQTSSNTLAGTDAGIDEATRILFDPTIFFGLADSARISKACELVQSAGVTADDVESGIAALLGINGTPGAAAGSMILAFKGWLEVKANAPTINDLLAESEAFWKNVRKIVTAEKVRMQGTVEGVADLNAAEAKELPPRHEVEAYKTQAEAQLIELRNRIASGSALIAHADRARQRRAAIAPIAASLAEKIALEAKCAADVAVAEAAVETASSHHDTLREACARMNRLNSEAIAAKNRRDQLSKEAATPQASR